MIMEAYIEKVSKSKVMSAGATDNFLYMARKPKFNTSQQMSHLAEISWAIDIWSLSKRIALFVPFRRCIRR